MKGVNTVEDQETFEVDVNSLDEARHIGAIRWSVDPSEIEVHVLDEGKRLFGILGKKMHVALSLRSQGPAGSLPFLEGLLERMGLSVEPEMTGPDSIDLNGEDAPIVIGRSGETLRAVEFLTNVALRGKDPGRGSGSTAAVTRPAGRRASRRSPSPRPGSPEEGRPIRLEPMSSWERRIVHVSLKDREDVSTCSTGSEPLRRVVVSPVQKGGQGSA